VVETWNGFLGPAAMPAEAVDKIAAEMRKIHADPEFQAKLEDAGITPIPEIRQAFAQRIQNDIAKWKPIIEEAGIKPE
jgi:tripartite-type tricarboxylate transporter receptor subunit TctC